MKTLSASTSTDVADGTKYGLNIGYKILEVRVQQYPLPNKSQLNLQIVLAPDGFM